MEFKFNDVNQAFESLVRGFDEGDIPTERRSSRNGPVIVAKEPMTITFTNPRRRVLFNSARDCNPFFHLYESFWMLAGKNDVKSLKHFASNIGDYSDDGETFHGSYGYRWRHWFGYDQLPVIVEELKTNPDSRRCVLQMWDGGSENEWDVTSDLNEAVTGGKDVPCNLCCMFSIRGTDSYDDANGPHVSGPSYLDVTVVNRSNDLIWGLLGANVVHMSYLLEYLATEIGVEVGTQTHFTNNLHTYTESNSGWKPNEWLDVPGWYDSWYDENGTMAVGKFTDSDLQKVINDPEVSYRRKTFCDNDYFTNTIRNAMRAFNHHKSREYSVAKDYCEKIEAPDWRLACTQWIEKRQTNWRKKNA